jgi:hypothetical protein
LPDREIRQELYIGIREFIGSHQYHAVVSTITSRGWGGSGLTARSFTLVVESYVAGCIVPLSARHVLVHVLSQGLHRGNPTLAPCPGSLGYGAPLCPRAVNSPVRPCTTPSGLGKGHPLQYHAFGPWERAPGYGTPGDPFGLQIVSPLRITRPGPSPASGLFHPLLDQASPPTPPYEQLLEILSFIIYFPLL